MRWIIGRGLLGKAVSRARAEVPFRAPVRWTDPESAADDLGIALTEFARGEGALEIYWCAGRGVTSSPERQLDDELMVFEHFLHDLLELPQPVRRRIQFFLASSVGGAYAGSASPPYTEATPVMPLSAYGRTKLAMESALREATARGGWRTFVGRITNIYGPGQDLGKNQGLISVLMAGHLTGRPVSLYVSLDTLRDYIHEDDCAAIIDAGMELLRSEAHGTSTLKLIGTGRAVSIGALLGEITRTRRRKGAVVLGRNDASGQSADLRIRSEVWPQLNGLARTTLPEGLDSVHRSQLMAHGRGRDDNFVL